MFCKYLDKGCQIEVQARKLMKLTKLRSKEVAAEDDEHSRI
jgi:hypothetical protein